MSATLELHFVKGERIELNYTYFRTDCNQEFRSVRGKTCGAYRGHGTFQWTSAVQALCQVFLLYKLAEKNFSIQPHLQGEAHTSAASLDYAIVKSPVWLSEMFGHTASGELIAKRIFRVSNPNRKRPGPVVISVNHHFISTNNVRIFLNQKLLNNKEEESILSAIWVPQNQCELLAA